MTPNSGEILVDKVNIAKNIEAWRHKIGYVQQDIFLLDDSIRQNIAFGEREEDLNTED